MSFLEGNLEHVAAFCVGTAALAFGSPPSGAMELAVGAAGLTGFVLGRTQKFGPECRRVRERIQRETLQRYQYRLSGSDDSLDARTELQIADEALKQALGKCILDRRALAASAVTPAGFPEQAAVVVLTALGTIRPDLFGHHLSETLAYRFAQDVIRAGIEAAVADADYYRKLEPDLMFELAKAVGGIRETLTHVADVQQHHAEMLRDQGEMVRWIAGRFGYPGGAQALDAEVLRLERELSATRSDLLALLSDIAGQGITADQMSSALATAKVSLQKSRAELEQLRGLANEVPEIEPHLTAARAALDNRHQIDLDAAQDAIRKAKTEYRIAVTRRHHTESVNMARLSEAEASILGAVGFSGSREAFCRSRG